MKNSELLELVGKKVSFEVQEDMHIGENKTITWQAGLSGELTCVVFTPDNVQKLIDTITFADSMGVSDIRIISSAQWNAPIEKLADIPAEMLAKYPILKYRVENFLQGRNVRGIADTDCKKCYLMMDDSIVAGDYHFPCVIHMREKGQAIGRVGENMRSDRIAFMQKHDTHKDPICKKNCLDVCVDYNNRVERFKTRK